MREKPLNQKLTEEPYRFDFFQAVRLLERMYPERTSVGTDVMPQNEVVRFRNHLSLSFPASQIQKIDRVFDEHFEQENMEMFVNFMGMIGITGVLPIHYTEIAMDRKRYGDSTLSSFMDIFTHRAVSLFFRAWEKYRFPIQYERGKDAFTGYLLSMIGIGTPGLENRMDVPDQDLLPYGGLIMQKPHSASALEQILSDYFGIKAKLNQFSGHWLDLEDESITHISGKNNVLGVNTIIGTRVWDYQSKFRIVLGALNFKEFQSFVPSGTAYKPLLSIVKFMISQEFDFEIQLKLKAREVPGCILTTRAKRRPMLGWTSFLKTKPFKEDDDQLVLQMPQFQ